MIDPTSSDLPYSPEGFFLSSHPLAAFFCELPAFCTKGVSPMGSFLLYFCSFLPLKSFFKRNVSHVYFGDVLSKRKRRLKAKKEEWRSERSTSGWGGGGIKVEERQRSRNVAREVWWWAGALIAKDNSSMKKRTVVQVPLLSFPWALTLLGHWGHDKGTARSWEGKTKYDIVYVGQRGRGNWGKTNYNRWTWNQYLAKRKEPETTSKSILCQEGFIEKTYWTEGCTDVTLSSEVWLTGMMLLFQCFHLDITATTFLNVIFGRMINK